MMGRVKARPAIMLEDMEIGCWARSMILDFFRIAIWLALTCAFACSRPETASGPAATWIPLFNGRDLDGWVPKLAGLELGLDPSRTFRVEDGVLRVVYDGVESFDGRFGHLFYRTPFARYRLRVEYRFTGEQTPGAPEWAWRNSGVMLHSQAPESMAVEQAFPVALEAQLLGGDGKARRPTANLCTPGTEVAMGGEVVHAHCVDSSSETFHGDRWVTVELEVRGGDALRHFVGGRAVLEYSAPRLDPNDPDARRLLAAGSPPALEQGFIALQAESHPVEFRRVDLLPLD
jgi:hypothetical protein